VLIPALVSAEGGWKGLVVQTLGTALIPGGLLDHRFLIRQMGQLAASPHNIEATAGMEAVLVEIAKRFVDKKTQTLSSLTGTGKEAIEGYWKEMESLRKGAQRWVPTGTLVPAG
jgi:hypothetical protein